MTGYVPIEYPKWVCGELANDRAEEEAIRAALAALPPSDPDRPLSPVAIRMRRTRARQREGRRVIPLDVSIAQIEALVAAGVLDPVSRGDAAEVAAAVCRLIDRCTPASLR